MCVAAGELQRWRSGLVSEFAAKFRFVRNFRSTFLTEVLADAKKSCLVTTDMWMRNHVMFAGSKSQVVIETMLPMFITTAISFR